MISNCVFCKEPAERKVRLVASPCMLDHSKYVLIDFYEERFGKIYDLCEFHYAQAVTENLWIKEVS